MEKGWDICRSHSRGRGQPVSEVGCNNPLRDFQQEGVKRSALRIVRWGLIKLSLPNAGSQQKSPCRQANTRESLAHTFPDHIRAEGMAMPVEVEMGKTIKDLCSRSV